MLLRQVLINEDQEFCYISYFCCGHQCIPHSGRQSAPFNPDNSDRNSQAAEQSKEFQGNTNSITLINLCVITLISGMRNYEYLIT